MAVEVKKTELLEAFLKALFDKGWEMAGQTPIHSYKAASLAYGGGPLVTIGGRQRFVKGDLKMTVGLNTLCLYRKPQNPETIMGQGRMAGRTLYTFRDWPMQNIEIKRIDLEDIPALLKRIESVEGQI